MWCKLKFDGNVQKEDIIKKLEEGYLPLELGYDGIIPNLVNCEWEAINDTEEYLSPEENDGEATIELMEETERGWLESIWDNSIKN
jgi:hypothetical protein